jgi:hypothetical protein
MRADTQRFYVTLENGETHNAALGSQVGTAAEETVGWAAFEAHHGTLGEMAYEAGSTPFSVTEQAYTISYKGFFRFAPHFFANIASYHGKDSAELRTTATTAASAAVQIEEETCEGEQDGPVGGTHGNAEQVDYVAILAGVGSSADKPGGGMQARPAASSDLHNGRTGGNHEATGNVRRFAEAGKITLDSNWITVQLKGYYFHPAIVAGTPSFNGGDGARRLVSTPAASAQTALPRGVVWRRRARADLLACRSGGGPHPSGASRQGLPGLVLRRADPGGVVHGRRARPGGDQLYRHGERLVVWPRSGDASL